jgi:hypothetical protein
VASAGDPTIRNPPQGAARIVTASVEKEIFIYTRSTLKSQTILSKVVEAILRPLKKLDDRPNEESFLMLILRPRSSTQPIR